MLIGNSSSDVGGGVFLEGYNASFSLQKCLFWANTGHYGGAIFYRDSLRLTMDQCGFLENQATDGNGGAIYVANGEIAAHNCVFTDNDASGSGGAIYADQPDPKEFYGCIFSGNSSGGDGGGIALSASALLLDHCTLADNDAAGEGGDIHATWPASQPLLINSIVWGSSPEPFALADRAEITVEQSDVQGGWPGSGNIDADPLFIAYRGFDYLLGIDSPCIDAGSGAEDALDWCSVHPVYCQYNTQTPDMGAYGGEYNAGWMP
jgi:predicted outer membrane repeat protein